MLYVQGYNFDMQFLIYTHRAAVRRQTVEKMYFTHPPHASQNITEKKAIQLPPRFLHDTSIDRTSPCTEFITAFGISYIRRYKD